MGKNSTCRQKPAKMQAALVFMLCLVFVASFSSDTRNLPRRYFPEEDDPYRLKYLMVEDKDGNVRYEDLLTEEKGPAASEEDVTFHLYTKENQNEAEIIKATDFPSILQSKHFKSAKKVKFLVHGWASNAEISEVNVLVKSALFVHHDINIFVVDWRGPANKFYTTSRNAVPIVGRITGDFISYLIETYGYSPKDFSLVGHSLGAHISGCVGATVKNKHGLVDYIVGLDPAGPLFTVSNTENRVDASDAQFVHIIHTNGGLLGFRSSLGHADYFPNGGSDQPGCGLDLTGACAHNRALKFFAESVISSGFISHICHDIKGYDNGHCSGNEKSRMGEYDVDRGAYGDYFLRTSKEPLYALGDRF